MFLVQRMWRRFIGQQVLARTPSQEHISLERGDHRPYVPHGQGAMSGTNEALWFAPGSDYMLGKGPLHKSMS